MSGKETVTAGPAPVARLEQPVLVADRVVERIHRIRDLANLVGAVLLIALILLIGAYAQGTTTAVTEDVRTAFGGILRQILLFPVTLFESIFVLVAPLVVIFALAQRRRLREIIESLTTSLVTGLLVSLFVMIAPHLPQWATASLTVTTRDGAFVAIDTLMAVLAAFLTVAGQANQVRSIRYSWIFLFVLSFLYVLRGALTLPSALVSLLIGRMIGAGARYLFGFGDDRGGAVDLVEGLLSIGITPRKIVRVDLDTSVQPLETTFVLEDVSRSQAAWTMEYLPLVERSEVDTESSLGEVELNTLTASATRPDRHYACWDTSGRLYDLIVLDPDTEVTSLMHDLWSNLRLKNLSRWVAPSLQATAERSALVKIVAHDAGVMTPQTLRVIAAGNSVFTVQEPVHDATLLSDIAPERLTDEVLDRFYTELKRAHRHGITHRALKAQSLALDEGDRTWVLNWDEGQVATTNVNRRIDLAQMLTVMTLLVGEERALASAIRVFGDRAVQLAAPILQKAVLPREVRRELRGKKDLLTTLRQSMVGDIPEQQVPDMPLERFSIKTIIMAIIGVVALWVVLGSLNFASVAEAVKSANPWWILVAFTLGLLTYVGAAMPLTYFVPEKLKLRETTLVQIAASVVALVAPAGIGPAALNLRYLNKKGVSTPLGLATVALVQFTQFVTTVVTLLLVVVITGRSTTLELPSSTVLYAVSIVVVIVALVLVIPKIRNEIWRRLEPTWNQIWGRLVWIGGQPTRLLLGVVGNLIMTVSYVAAFGASLAAFGYSLDATTLAITFLASSSLGSVIPSPGGIGPVEAALTAGLTVAGIPSGVAISTALLYRLVTFYARAPIGWVALHFMQKRGIV